MRETTSLVATKSNDLIQNFECPFTLQQQKICLYLVSQLNPWEKSFRPLVVSISDFCKKCGLAVPGGKDYSELKKAIKDFGFKWIKRQRGEEEAIIWFKSVTIDSGNIIFEFNERMMPYILYLQNNFTQIELVYTTKMRSKYSVRIYELLYSLYYDKNNPYEKTIDLNDLKQKVSADYKLFADFRRFVLTPAIDEINRLTDINVGFDAIKEGRKVVSIKFKMNLKRASDRVELLGVGSKK